MAYLPHDEAVAAGLGGLDAQESQAVVDLLNDRLAALLRAPPREFWRQGNRILSLIESVIVPFACLDAMCCVVLLNELVGLSDACGFSV